MVKYISDTRKVSYHTTDPLPVHTYSEIVMLKVYICLKGVGERCPWRGLFQVPTQGIAIWVEGWPFVFVTMGEDILWEADQMYYRRVINYYNYKNMKKYIFCYSMSRDVQVLCAFAI